MSLERVLLFAMVMALMYAPSSQAPDCTSPLMQIVSCFNFVEGNATRPDKACCTGLSTLYNNTPVCLCELISSPEGLSTPGINISNAVLLPSYCNVPTDTSRCPGLLTGETPTGNAASSNSSSGSGKSNLAFAGTRFPPFLTILSASPLILDLLLKLDY